MNNSISFYGSSHSSSKDSVCRNSHSFVLSQFWRSQRGVSRATILIISHFSLFSCQLVDHRNVAQTLGNRDPASPPLSVLSDGNRGPVPSAITRLRHPPEEPSGSGFALDLRSISQVLRRHARSSKTQQNAEFLTEYTSALNNVLLLTISKRVRFSRHKILHSADINNNPHHHDLDMLMLGQTLKEWRSLIIIF
ncbi:hypothetical protein T4D_11138 [Trichinella pseudospiralis]|uniref:Uncharacterized protein n=1 Tax=Trichinella pseudospiralis TaxID=6337 RepID=A0A0V1G0K1_TRIPS|nr:hypothetical protein T4D_11138 [Trichinella pseudospiralis]